jgi:hypothetical protein
MEGAIRDAIGLQPDLGRNNNLSNVFEKDFTPAD